MSSDDNREFLHWVFSTARPTRPKLVGFATVFALLIALKTLARGFLPPLSLEPKDFTDWLSNLPKHLPAGLPLAFSIQAFACVLLVGLIPEPSESESDDPETTRKASRQVRRCFTAVFVTWALYYATAAVAHLLNMTQVAYACSITCDVASAVALLWLYFELSAITVNPYSTIKRHRTFFDVEAHKALSIAIALIVVAVGWIVAFAPVDTAFGSDNSRFGTAFVSSSLAGVSFALVVGCFGVYMRPGPVAAGALYFYAMIQLSAVLFPKILWVEAIATTIALPLKVLFWLLFVWAFITTRMWVYLREGRKVLNLPWPGAS